RRPLAAGNLRRGSDRRPEGDGFGGFVVFSASRSGSTTAAGGYVHLSRRFAGPYLLTRAAAVLAVPPPSTSGPGRHPFKVVARVRIPLGALRLCAYGPLTARGSRALVIAARSRRILRADY